MDRRRFLTQGLAALALASPAAAAQDHVETVLAQLRALGYSQFSVKRTLLGRAQILAFRGGDRREIILNPRTGEILRDLRLDDKGRVRLSDDDDDRNGDRSSGSGSGSGSDSSGGRADGHSGDDRDDDDRSGSGSGSSGSSGSGSGGDDDGGDDRGDDSDDDDS